MLSDATEHVTPQGSIFEMLAYYELCRVYLFMVNECNSKFN